MTTTNPFIMSIETTEGKSYRHGFHLGTIESTARDIVEDTFKTRVKEGMPTVTIALMRENKIVDVFHGDKWQSEYAVDDAGVRKMAEQTLNMPDEMLGVMGGMTKEDARRVLNT